VTNIAVACLRKSLTWFSLEIIKEVLTLEPVELTAPSEEGLVVSVSFISNTGRLAADAGALDWVGRGLSLFAVLEDGF